MGGGGEPFPFLSCPSYQAKWKLKYHLEKYKGNKYPREINSSSFLSHFIQTLWMCKISTLVLALALMKSFNGSDNVSLVRFKGKHLGSLFSGLEQIPLYLSFTLALGIPCFSFLIVGHYLTKWGFCCSLGYFCFPEQIDFCIDFIGRKKGLN